MPGKNIMKIPSSPQIPCFSYFSAILSVFVRLNSFTGDKLCVDSREWSDSITVSEIVSLTLYPRKSSEFIKSVPISKKDARKCDEAAQKFSHNTILTILAVHKRKQLILIDIVTLRFIVTYHFKWQEARKIMWTCLIITHLLINKRWRHTMRG